MARAATRFYITADSSGVRKGTREAERDIGRMGKAGSVAFTGLKVSALAAGAAIGGAFAVSLRTGISELMEAEKVGAQTAAAIRSTGSAAGVTRKHIEDMASSLQSLTGKEDDAIQAAANLGLSFTKVRNEGAGVNAVYDRMLRATVDISARTGRDLNPVMQALGRSLNDPVKGMSALSRIGVQFDQETRERIKTLVEEGRVLQAQKVILSEVERRYKGAGEAAGKTLAGQMERAKRSFEDVSQQLAVELIPVFTELLKTVQRNMPTIRKAIEGVAGTVRWVTGIVRNIANGDWTKAWNSFASGVTGAFDRISAATRSFAYKLRRDLQDLFNRDPILRSFGRFIGLIDDTPTAGSITGRSTGRVANPLIGGRTGVTVNPDSRIPGGAAPRFARAMGGMIPGTYRGVDDRLALVASGEAVLTPRQQAMVPGGRATLDRIFRATGGVVGGRGFADGGWVHPAPGTSRGGGPGQGTHSYGAPPDNWQSDTAYDLMGRDGMPVYAAHAGRISGVRPFSSDPRFWGMAAYLDVPGGQFYYKHLKSLAVKPGQRVSAGQLIGVLGTGVNGGPHLHLGATSRSLLERAVNASAAASGYGARGDGHDTPDDEARQAPRGGLTVKQFKSGLRVDAAERRAGAGGDMTAVGSITGRHADDQLQERRMQAAGAPESRVLQARRNELIQDVRDIDGRLGDLGRRLRTYVQRRVKLRKEALDPKTKPARRAQIRELIGNLIDLETQIQDAQRTLRSERTDLIRQAQILGYDIADAQASEEQAARDAAADTGSGGDTAAGTETTVTNELTAAQRAGINQGILAEEFIRTAFGPGDIGMGGRTAFGAATGGAWVPIRVDASSFAAATAAAAGSTGYVTASLVPSGA